MKTILQNKNQDGKRTRFLLLSLVTLLFTMQSYAQSPCNAGFAFYSQNNYFTFIDSSYTAAPDSIIGWSWSFGDGGVGIGTYVTHQYNATGTFTVCLTITTALGCTNTTCQTVTIVNVPCNMTASIIPDTSGTGLYVAVNGGVQPISFLWSNGATTNYISTPQPGYYCVTVTDSTGCIVIDCDSSGVAGCNPYFIYNMQAQAVSFQNYSSGTYSSVLWDFGDSLTSTALNPSHTYANPGTYTVCLSLYTGGILCNQFCQVISVQAPFNSTLCGIIFVDQNGNGVFDSLDTYLNNQYIFIYGNGVQLTAYTDSLTGSYSVNVPAGNYTISYCPNNSNAVVTLPIDSSVYCGVYYNVTIGANQTQCGYNFAIQYTTVVIEGTAFADLNTNGAYDSGEPGLPYQTVNVGNYSAYTNSNGQYSINVPAGTYNIQYTPQGSYSSFPLTTPGTISLIAAAVGSSYQGNDFGINIPAGTTDISVQLLPHTTVTPGFPAWYDIYVCNNGLVPVAANVTMIYDPVLAYTNSYPVYATINTSTNTITWTTSLILPGNCTTIWVDFVADSLLALGVSTFEMVTAFPVTGSDINLSDNTDTIHQISIGSWDPNSKLSIKTNNNDPNQQVISAVNPDQEITYTVNFQNLGSAPAVNVIVVDQLSTNLDANSFSLSATSHPCNVVRNGNQVTYTFSNMMLPDSATSAIGSHGFISFKANAKNSLVPGTILSDNASVYFDFNQPVVTGNTHIIMINPLGINEQGIGLKSIAVYPNPVKESAVIDYSLTSAAIVKLEIMDINGRVCQKLINENQSEGSHSITWKPELNGGVYFVKLQLNDQISMTKVSVVK